MEGVSAPVVSTMTEDVVHRWFPAPRPEGVHILGATLPNKRLEFVVVDVRGPKEKIEVVSDWTSAFVAALHGRSGTEYFIKENGSFRPVILVVGKGLPHDFQQKALSAGSIVYDLTYPSNAMFTEPQHIVSHLASRNQTIREQRPGPWAVDPKADPARYYDPVPGVTPKDVHDYFDFLNRNSL